MKKTKILYLVSTLEAKGPTNQLFYIIKHLDKSTFEPLILTLSPEPAASLKPLFDQEGIPVQTLGTGRITGLVKNSKIIRSVIETFQPDIVQSMGIRADAYNAQLPARIKKITTSRNFPLEDYPSKFGKLKGYLMAKKHLSSFKSLEVIACSKSISAQLATVGIRTHTIQNGVDLDRFFPAASKGVASSPVKKFVTVGSLIPRKNVETIINAFNSLGDDYHLTVVGEGPLKEQLKQQVIGSSIEFVGHLENVTSVLHEAHGFISASRAEGLPNAVLEAMATDIPVILSDIPPHRELVEGTVFQTNLFAADDADALRQIILKCSQEKDKSMGARAWVVANFSAQTMSKRYQEFYLNSTV